MRLRRTMVGAAALLALTGVAISGCSGDDDGGAESTTTAVAEPWDPCSLSDEKLREATLDPSTEGPGLTAMPPGWKTCAWDGNDVDLFVASSTTATVDEVRNGPRNVDFHDVTIGDRAAFTHRTAGDERVCNLVLPIPSGGLVTMELYRPALTKDTTPMCEWAVRVGDELVAELPD